MSLDNASADRSDVDVFSAEVRGDPYVHYRRLRAGDPVQWSARNGAWIVTSYAHAQQALADPRICHWSVAGQPQSDFGGPSHAARMLGKWLSLMDPRRQSRLRKLTAIVFRSGALQSLTVSLQQRVDHLLAGAPRGGSLDVIGEFADPIALEAISTLLGVRAEARPAFERVVHDMGGRLFSAIGAAPDDGPAGALSLFLRDLLREKGRHLADDLMSAVIRAQREGDELDDEDVLAFVVFFLFAGHENVLNFVGNAVHALAHSPGEWARLRANGTLIGCAVEELLRYDSPVQFMMVTSAGDLHLAGKRIQQGEPVLVGIGAANRDPERFSNPDCLDIGRQDNAHLAFGLGPLTCIGAAFARLEGQIAIGSLARRLERLTIRTTPRWRQSPPVLRGPLSLVVELDA